MIRATDCTCVWQAVATLMVLIVKDPSCPHVRHRDSEQSSSPLSVYRLRRRA